jgi:hypothetical protein
MEPDMAVAKKKPAPARKAAAPARTARTAPAKRKAAAKSMKPGAKPARKTVPVTVPVAVAAVPLAAPPAVKADKPKKPKLVRDSFTIPKAEYGVLQALKERAGKLGRPAKKSEVLRAGITLLAGLPDGAFVAALAAVPTLKTGRPARD